MQLGSKMIPMATKMVTKLLPVVATGAVGALTDFGVSTALGSGVSNNQKGGFLIPQDKINQVIAHKNLLTKNQKEQILSSLESGGKLVIKPTPKQRGAFLGTLLASIGVLLLVKALTGGNIQNRQFAVSSKILHIPYIPLPPKNSGKGMQSRPYSDMFLPYVPPPFWGNPTNPTNATGTEGNKNPKKTKRKQKGKGLLLGKNSPFKDVPLLGMMF